MPTLERVKEWLSNLDVAEEETDELKRIRRALDQIAERGETAHALSGDTDVDETARDRPHEDPTGRAAREDSAPYRPSTDKQHGFDSAEVPETRGKSGETSSAETTSGLEWPTRYEQRRLVAVGGMGEVHCIYDHELSREVIAKVIRNDRKEERRSVLRFIDEAQITAQLDHHGIPPVYDLGQLPGERYYFTMKLLEGDSLERILASRSDERADSPAGRASELTTDIDTSSRRSLLKILRSVSETVAYAHSRGVVHRDLKPENILVGNFGEVRVLDWGIARVLEEETIDVAEAAESAGPVANSVAELEESSTGAILGTAAYMAPEQVRGQQDRIQPASDVFSLGTMLYEILAGRPAFGGDGHLGVLLEVLEGPEPEPTDLEDVPPRLAEICASAMSLEPGDRYADAEAFERKLAEWLEDERQRDKADELYNRAQDLHRVVDSLRQAHRSTMREAMTRLSDVPPHAPVVAKRKGWQAQDRAEDLEQEIERFQEDYTDTLRAALRYDDEHESARRDLAREYRRRHWEAEERDEGYLADNLERKLQGPSIAGMFHEYLGSRARLSLETVPEGARAMLYSFEEVDRRLVTRPACDLEETPLESVAINHGNYLLELSASGRSGLRVPIRMRRGNVWRHAPPDSDAEPIELPPAGEIDPGSVVVAGGWFECGSDSLTGRSLERQRIWVEPFVMRRFPVTHEEYLVFLNDLLRRGEKQKVRQYAPRMADDFGLADGPIGYARDADGLMTLESASAADWEPGWPVFSIDHRSARAYAAWRREQSGRAWRLPTELEWEKAARGTDLRTFPWGNFLDPTWCRMVESTAGEPGPTSVSAHPTDRSPYDVRGLAGNVAEWCSQAFRRATGEQQRRGHRHSPPPAGHEPEDSFVAARGGSWLDAVEACSAIHRRGFPMNSRLPYLGFRLVRSAT